MQYNIFHIVTFVLKYLETLRNMVLISVVNGRLRNLILNFSIKPTTERPSKLNDASFLKLQTLYVVTVKDKGCSCKVKR